MRRVRALCLLAVVPAPAWACGFCYEHMLKIRHPEAGALVPVVLAWFLALFVLHFAARLEAPGALRSAAGVLTLLGCGAAIVMTGGAFTPAMLVAGGGLGAYAAAKLGYLAATRGKSKPLFVHAAVHASFLGLVAFVGLRAAAAPDEPARLVSLLRYSIADTGGVAVPRVLALGAAAVGPLTDAAREGLRTEADTRYLAFCLERLCDSGGEKPLESLAMQFPGDDQHLRAWEPLVFAFAGCAKERAVEPLGALLAKAPEGRRAEVVLEALIRTGTRQGLDAALTRLPVLVAAIGKDPVGAKAAVVLDALATATTPAELRALPLYRDDGHLLALSGPPEGFEYEFYWKDPWPPQAKDVPPSWKDAAALSARWTSTPQ